EPTTGGSGALEVTPTGGQAVSSSGCCLSRRTCMLSGKFAGLGRPSETSLQELDRGKIGDCRAARFATGLPHALGRLGLSDPGGRRRPRPLLPHVPPPPEADLHRQAAYGV